MQRENSNFKAFAELLLLKQLSDFKNSIVSPIPIGKWTKEEFINRFKSFDSDSARNISVKPDEFNTIMPWTFYGGMTREDLGAIYDYLRTIKPVHHQVNRFTPVKD